jgi:CBS domain-containing protein
VSVEPLWWPPAKIVGRHFAPFLATVSGTEVPRDVSTGPHGVAVEIELGARDVDRLTAHRLNRVVEALGEKKGGRTVGEVMSPDPLLVAPEDTLGEIAEKMRERDTGSVLVADFGRLIGILTSRDLLRAYAGRVHPSEGRVREWMTADPIAVSAETALEAAAILMTEHAIHHLPVVEGEHAVGMVGLREVTRSADRRTIGIGLGF